MLYGKFETICRGPVPTAANIDFKRIRGDDFESAGKGRRNLGQRIEATRIGLDGDDSGRALPAEVPE
jgi:hypothetical protein